jgi:hypothetical protein
MVTPGMWYDQLRLAGDFSPQRGIIGRESRAFSSKLVDSRILERHKRCSYKVDGCHLETVRFRPSANGGRHDNRTPQHYSTNRGLQVERTGLSTQPDV